MTLPNFEQVGGRSEEASRENPLIRIACALTVVVVVACGGGSKAPATEEDAKASDEPATSEPAEKKESDAPPSDKSESSNDSSSSGGEASPDDRKAVLQLVIDDEELGKYLRVTEPGRFPLKVSGSDIPSGLVKATKPIEIVGEPSSPKAPVLVINAVEVGAKKASVSYQYGAEGIKGTTTLEKGPRGWEILRSRIVEHFRPDAK
jgi:hypothetical protein